MIELIQKSDTGLIKDLELRHCIEQRLSHLPFDFKYPEYGYFCIIESASELYRSMKFAYGDVPLIEDFFEYLELVEEDESCFEAVLVLTQDFGVSLIVKKLLLAPPDIEKLREYKEY